VTATEAAGDDLTELLAALSPDELTELLDELPAEVTAVLAESFTTADTTLIPDSPLTQAQALDPMFVPAAHLVYLIGRIVDGLRRVEAGESVYIAVTMPPRMGKTTTLSKWLPVWTLRLHPDWPIILTSHSPTLVTSWGRAIRRLFTTRPDLGIKIAPDAGAASEWETTAGGSVVSRSLGADITGRGAKVLIIDDPHKGLAEAHSEVARNKVWDWYIGDAYTRLDRGGHMVIVVMTRWHEDDLIGRLLSVEHEGDPDEWEVISFPAIADEADVLGRKPGDPLLSPQAPNETREEALTAWEKIKRAVGTYVWAALYLCRPAPSKGQIFDVSWFRYWTTNEANVTEDGKVVYLNPLAAAPEGETTGRWLDSWDMAFKAKEDSDYVVGSRWLQRGANRYLIRQFRGRITFTQTVQKMRDWATREGTGAHIYERLVEDKANGTAVIDTLKEELSGIIAIDPTTSKIARARSVTPDVEAGNVLLPYPGDPGNEWVADYLAEFRSFPTGAHDDQVDSTVQALRRMRGSRGGSITVPGRHGSTGGSRLAAPMTSRRIGGRDAGRRRPS
jgi:predicted phage terminase large subunit-like protein